MKKVNSNGNNSQIISILDSYKDKEKKKTSYKIGFKIKLVEYINSIQNDDLWKKRTSTKVELLKIFDMRALCASILTTILLVDISQSLFI